MHGQLRAAPSSAPRASATRGTERSPGTSVDPLSMAAQLFSCLKRQERRGQAAVRAPDHPPLCQGSTFFPRTEISHRTPNFRWYFAATLPFWRLGFVSQPLRIVWRTSTEMADNGPRISQLLNEYRLHINADSAGCQAISFCSLCCLGGTFNFYYFFLCITKREILSIYLISLATIQTFHDYKPKSAKAQCEWYFFVPLEIKNQLHYD